MPGDEDVTQDPFHRQVIAADDDEDERGPFRIGQVVAGVFEISAVLGAGGMGVVYEALDRRLLRRVAIKTARDVEHAAALRTEAQGLTAIGGRGFVNVHAFLEHGGVEFIVMERLYGDTLETRLQDARAKGEPLPVDDVVELLIEIAAALSAAHRAGVAQRDLKPSNVMLCGARVVIIDLGLFIPEIMAGPSSAAAGSIEYIAPEVMLGDVKRGQGPLIDLYALGILAFEALTNRTPFGTGTATTTVLGHLYTPTPDVRSFRPDVPPPLAALIEDLLAKEPDRRPASAEAVVWQLLAIRDDARRMPRMRVLAVDDDVNVGRALKRSLESSYPKLHVDTTTNPALALDGGAGTPPDVILVDLNMPMHNGVEICMSLLALPDDRRPIVVAMSAEANANDLEVLSALGVCHFVPKDENFVSAMSGIVARLRERHEGVLARRMAPPASRVVARGVVNCRVEANELDGPSRGHG